MVGAITEEQFKALHTTPGADPSGQRNGTRVDLADGSKAYLSLPKGPGPHPGIIVVHEWWGLNGHMEAWADRLAALGWAALAVDLYGKVAKDPDEAMAMGKAVDETKGKATMHAALEFLMSDARTKSPVQAVIGWCFGGAWSLKAAIAEPELDGAIIYYGHLETDPAKLAPIKASVLGIFGNNDPGIPPEEVNKFEAALKQAGVKHAIHRYDAQHAFANPSNTEKYDEKNAAAAWGKVQAFLDTLRR